MAVQKDILESAGVPAQDVQRLEAAWAAYQSAKEHPARDIPCIVCTGIYNAGKSTLLNALTGTEHFPTGDVPTTKTVAQAELDGAVYIDTPGLNAAEADDMETQAAYEVADFILFVSSAVSGGISQAEAAWLRTLGERYDLGQRLIFVLTKCGQVAPEELSGITEQFRQDLEKTVGAGEVIPVDSITYRKGVAEGKALLVEHSGIPALKEHLAEKIAAAERLLAQAREGERNQRRQEVLEQIEQVQTVLQDKKDQASRKNLEQIAAVDRVWAEFEEALGKAMPQKDRRIVPRYIFISLSRTNPYGHARSESAARSKLADELRSVYNSRNQVLGKSIDPVVADLRRRYCTSGMDSEYFGACNHINKEFEKSILKLQGLGISMQRPSDISVQPELPSGLAYEIDQILRDDVVRSDGYYSLDKYIDMYASIDYDTYGRYEKGFLGIERLIHEYDYCAGNAEWEMEKDMRSSLETNIEIANNQLGTIWKGFCEKVNAEVSSRKSALKQQVDAYKSTLTRSAEPADLQPALTHLETLEREVRQ